MQNRKHRQELKNSVYVSLYFSVILKKGDFLSINNLRNECNKLLSVELNAYVSAELNMNNEWHAGKRGIWVVYYVLNINISETQGTIGKVLEMIKPLGIQHCNVTIEHSYQGQATTNGTEALVKSRD